jgi:hypothetical protein
MKQLQIQGLQLDNAAKAQQLAAGGKPPTAAQTTASLYATRTAQADDTISKLADTIVKMNSISYAGQVSAEANTVTHGMASSDIQQIRQAERNFVNAVLRRESGAAISQSEFDNAEKQYFPQPGDSAETLVLKNQNRQAVISNLKQASGTAGTADQSDLSAQVASQGYDYDAMKADGLSDADIKAAIGL